jgi:hypothetical protein
MPNIASYTSPAFDLNPAERGTSSWDATARRINAFYGDIAGFQRQQGSLAAQAEKQKLWPFDILAMYEKKAAFEAAQAAKTNQGGRVRFAYGGRVAPDPFARDESLRSGWTPGYNDFAQVSAGAGALGRGVSDGGYQAARMPRGGGGGGGIPEGGGPDYTLLEGEFVTAAQEKKFRAQDAEDAYKRQNDLRSYWQQYYGYEPNGIATGPGTERPKEGYTDPRDPTARGPRGYVPEARPEQPSFGWGEYISNRLPSTDIPDIARWISGGIGSTSDQLPVPGY